MYDVDVTQKDFIFVKFVGKRNVSHYAAEIVNGFHGYEYEIRYSKTVSYF